MKIEYCLLKIRLIKLQIRISYTSIYTTYKQIQNYKFKDKERFINAIKHKLNGTERSDVLADIEAGAADISDIKVY